MKYVMMGAGILIITIVAILQAFLPSVLPRLYNMWYEFTGMQTRVAPEDYKKWGVRSAGLIVLALELASFVYRLATRSH